MSDALARLELARPRSQLVIAAPARGAEHGATLRSRLTAPARGAELGARFDLVIAASARVAEHGAWLMCSRPWCPLPTQGRERAFIQLACAVFGCSVLGMRSNEGAVV